MVSQEAGQVVWYSHLFKNSPQFVLTHTVSGFGVVTKAELDVFLELSCFFYDPADVDNLKSGSSAFSKTSLNIWKFMVHILLKPGLENFKHYFTSMWDESITMKKTSKDDGIPAELFKILKDDTIKYCTQYASKFVKFSSGHRTGRG